MAIYTSKAQYYSLGGMYTKETIHRCMDELQLTGVACKPYFLYTMTRTQSIWTFTGTWYYWLTMDVITHDAKYSDLLILVISGIEWQHPRKWKTKSMDLLFWICYNLYSQTYRGIVRPINIGFNVGFKLVMVVVILKEFINCYFNKASTHCIQAWLILCPSKNKNLFLA